MVKVTRMMCCLVLACLATGEVYSQESLDDLLGDLDGHSSRPAKTKSTKSRVTVAFAQSNSNGSRTNSGRPKQALSAKGQAFKDDVKVEFGEGRGETVDEALKDAMRDVLQKVVGTYVDAEFRMSNDEIIKDEILTHSNGFIDRYKQMDVENEPGGTGKIVTIKAWVKMRDFVNRVTNIAPSQKIKVDGLLLDNSIVNDLNAEALIKKEFADFDPIRDLLEVRVVDAVRPTIISRSSDIVKMRFVYVISYSKEKYYRQFLPRVNKVLDQVSTTKPQTFTVPFGVKKLDFVPLYYGSGNYASPWKEMVVPGFGYPDSREAFRGRKKPSWGVRIAQSVSGSGVVSIREWSLPECGLWSSWSYASGNACSCALCLLDAQGNAVAQGDIQIPLNRLFGKYWGSSTTDIDLVPMFRMPEGWYDVKDWGTLYGGMFANVTNYYGEFVDRIVGYIDVKIATEDVAKVKSAEVKLDSIRKVEGD